MKSTHANANTTNKYLATGFTVTFAILVICICECLIVVLSYNTFPHNTLLGGVTYFMLANFMAGILTIIIDEFKS